MICSQSNLYLAVSVPSTGMQQTSLVPRLLRGRSKEPGTHCLRMLSYPRISGALETSGYYAAISLRLSSYYRSLHAYN